MAARQTDARIVLIIGATGSFGAHAAVALIRHGWAVKALARDPDAAALKAGAHMPIMWVKGDAMNAADVMGAAQGAGVIIHAANPPGYKDWRGLAIPMLANAIAAAKAQGARLVLPGNVYNYAPDAGPRIAETAPQAPVTRKGQVRLEMENMLEQGCQEGARGLILRAGDFFGPAAPNSALQWLTVGWGGRLRAVMTPGPARVGHAFAYMPDLAEALARLLEREAELAVFERFHFAGHWIARGDEMANAIRHATGDTAIAILPFPYPLIWALSPFVEMLRELLEMRYLWQNPIGLDDAKLRAVLGDVPATPFDVAVRETLSDMGYLDEPGRRRASRPPAPNASVATS